MDNFLDKLNKIVPVKWQWILNHEGFRRYFKNTGWMMFGRVASIMVSFFVGAYIARYLGPDRFGLMNYAISFASIFLFLSGLGIDSILVRELVVNKQDKNKLLGTGFIIKLVSSFAAVIVTGIAAFIVNKDFFTNVLIICFSFFVIFQSFNAIDLYLQAKVWSKKAVIIQVIVLLVSTILKLSFIYLNLGILPFVLVYVVEHFITAVGLIIIYQKNDNIFSWNFDKSIAKNLLTSSWPLILASVSASIYLRIDQVLIKFFMNDSAVGIYSVAVKLSEVWYFIPGLICASLFPAILNAKKTNDAIYESRLKKLYSLLFYLSFILIVITMILAKPIIYLLFGSQYLSALIPLQIYAWSNIGVFWSAAVNQYLISENYTKISFLVNFFGMILNIILNIILIPKLGISGAAIATLISYLFSAFSIVFFKKTRGQALLLIQSVKFL